MGLADYMSRNPPEPAKPPSTYDENFIIAQIDVIKEILQILRKRADQRNITTTPHNVIKNNSQRLQFYRNQHNGIVPQFQQPTKLPTKTIERQAQKNKGGIVERFHTDKKQQRQTQYNYKKVTKD